MIANSKIPSIMTEFFVLHKNKRTVLIREEIF